MLDKITNNQKKIIDNQSVAEDAADVRAEVANENADHRAELAEATADTRCNSIMRHVSRGGWKTIAVVVSIAILFACYEEYRVQMAVNEAKETAVKNAELNSKINGLRKGIARRDEHIEAHNRTILSLHEAAETEKQIHYQYYKHMGERAEGLTDHIMSLNEQLDEKDAQLEAKDKVIDHQIKLANRWRTQRDTKNQFMALARSIAYDNPVRMEEILGNDDFTRMIYYKLAVNMAIGLQSFNVLEWIQTLDGWDKTITVEMAARVSNPKTVPIAEYQKLEDELSFAEIIENLPFAQKNSWNQFVKQMKKHNEENFINYFKEEIKNSKEVEDTAGSRGPKNACGVNACGVDW